MSASSSHYFPRWVRSLEPLLMLLIATTLFGCSNATSTNITPAPAAVTPEPATVTPAPAASAYEDPFAYCAAVDTIDAPDDRYTGPEMPETIVEGLKKALDAPADAPDDFFTQGSFWRCMNGKLYACTVGANLPCQEKATTDRTPTELMQQFCQENPDSDFIPMVVTGHAVIYEWRCTNGQPETVQQIVEPDEQGFLSNIWYEISPN